MRRILPVLGLMSLAAMVLLAPWVMSRVPHCPMRTLVHLPCPGCGLGHALLALHRLDLSGALVSYPPLGALLLIVPLLMYIAVRGRVSARIAGTPGFVVILLVLGNWVYQLLANNGVS